MLLNFFNTIYFRKIIVVISYTENSILLRSKTAQLTISILEVPRLGKMIGSHIQYHKIIRDSSINYQYIIYYKVELLVQHSH